MTYTFSTTSRGTTLYIDGYETCVKQDKLTVVKFAMSMAIAEAAELRRMDIQSRWDARYKK